MGKSKLFIFLILSVCANTLHAQRPWKEYLVPSSLMIVSGMLEGTNEALMFHYKYGFKKKFPDASDLYWNPNVSWRNKY